MLSLTVDQVKTIGQVKEMLLGCSTEEGINDVFSQFGITDFSVKTMLLRQSMQVQEVFDAPDSSSFSDEELYREELSFFLDGKWKDLV